MRFVLGLLLGFGIGLGGAILFAPEKKKQNEWPPHAINDAATANNHDSSSSIRAVLATVRERVDEALAEAKDAKQQAERDMRDRYERAVGRKDK
jgi:hypothetical protein